MISYLLPILGGVAGVGFTSVVAGRYLQESFEEKLEWLDSALAGIKDKENFKHGISVKIENLNRTLDCDETWKKKKTNDSYDGEACSSVSDALNAVEKHLVIQNSGNFNEVVSKVQKIDRNHSYCSIFNWTPTQQGGEIGLKEIARALLESNCFNSLNEGKAKEFKKFFDKITSSAITIDQENSLIGGIIAGSLGNVSLNWAEAKENVNTPIREWNSIASSVLRSVKEYEGLTLKSKPKNRNGWTLVKLRKN